MNVALNEARGERSSVFVHKPVVDIDPNIGPRISEIEKPLHHRAGAATDLQYVDRSWRKQCGNFLLMKRSVRNRLGERSLIFSGAILCARNRCDFAPQEAQEFRRALRHK